MMVDRSTRCCPAASAMVTSCRTNCSQISYFCEGDSIRFARRPARPVPLSSSDMIRSSNEVRRTRRMLSDRHADLYREVRRKPDEISYKRGHRYLTVVADHDTGRVVWL